jgi:hypothetical protein
MNQKLHWERVLHLKSFGIEASGDSWRKLFHKSDVSRIDVAIARAENGEEVLVHGLKTVRSDGMEVETHSATGEKAVRNPVGQFVQAVPYKIVRADREALILEKLSLQPLSPDIKSRGQKSGSAETVSVDFRDLIYYVFPSIGEAL